MVGHIPWQVVQGNMYNFVCKARKSGCILLKVQWFQCALMRHGAFHNHYVIHFRVDRIETYLR